MSIFNKNINEILLEDILSLKEDEIVENINLDYKLKLPEKKDPKSGSDFAKDVCAFANTSGGLLLFGIQEEDGKAFPKEIIGIDEQDFDDEFRRLSSIINNRLTPILSGYSYNTIKLNSEKSVFIFKVPKSYSFPHMLRTDNGFWYRAENQNANMDVSTIRKSMLISESWKNDSERFRLDRLTKIRSNQCNVNGSEPFIALHLIPLSISDNNINNSNIFCKVESKYKDSPSYELPMLFEKELKFQLQNKKYDFDGLKILSKSMSPNYIDNYFRLFKNGALEIFDSWRLKEYRDKKSFGVPCEYLFSCILDNIPKYLEFLKEVEIDYPFYFSVSLMNIKGMHLTDQIGFSEMKVSDSLDSDRDVYYLDGYNIHSKDDYDKAIVEVTSDIQRIFGLINYKPREINSY